MCCVLSFAKEFISTVPPPSPPFPRLSSSVVNIPAGLFAVRRFDTATALEEAAGRAAKAQADAEASLKKAQMASNQWYQHVAEGAHWLGLPVPVGKRGSVDLSASFLTSGCFGISSNPFD